MKKFLLMILSILCLFSFAMASACSCGGNKDGKEETGNIVLLNGFNEYHDMVVIYLNPSFVIGNFTRIEKKDNEDYVVEGDASYKYYVKETKANQPELKMPAKGLKNDITDVSQFGLYVYNANEYTFKVIVTAYSGDNVVCSLTKDTAIGANNLLFDVNRVIAVQTGKVITDYSISFSGLKGESVLYLDNFHVITTDAPVEIPAAIKEVIDGINNITSETSKATLESLVAKYNALSEEDKKCVVNHDSLTAAIMPYWLEDLGAAQTSDPGTLLYFDKPFGPLQVEDAMAGISSYYYTTEKAYGDEVGSLKVAFETTGTNWLTLSTSATTPIEEEYVRFYVYNDSDQYKGLCTAWLAPSSGVIINGFMVLAPHVWSEVTVKSKDFMRTDSGAALAGSFQFCGLVDPEHENYSPIAPEGNVYISSVVKRDKYQDFNDQRIGEDENTLFFFDRQLGIRQLSIDTDKILATVNSDVTFNGEPTTQLVFKSVYPNGYINIDISGYEFNAGDVAVFYAKTSDMENGIEYVDIRLNTDPDETYAINGNHLVVGKWTMCMIPAERLEEALTQLYFFGGKANGYTTEAYTILGSIYLTKIKVYSADDVRKMTTFDSTTEYQIGQTTFVNSVENLTGTWNPNNKVFADDWDTNPYLIGDEVRVYARPQFGVANKENALGFELKDAVDTHSGKKLYVVASGLTGTPYIQVFDVRGGTHYCTHSGVYGGKTEDGYAIYCFDIVDAWASNPAYAADSMKYFRLFTGHKLTIPNYEAVMIKDFYIADPVQKVIDGINNITSDTPKVTLESLVAQYNNILSEEDKKLVSNYDRLIAAIKPYWSEDLEAAQTSDPDTFLYFDEPFGPVQVESVEGISFYYYTTEKAYGDETGSLKVVFETTGTWVSLNTSAKTPIEEEYVRFYVYNDSDQYKALRVSGYDPSVTPTSYGFMLLKPRVWTKVVVKSEYLTEAGSLQFCGLSDSEDMTSLTAPVGNVYISSVRGQYQDFVDARTGEDENTLFFFDRQLGIEQLSIDTDKISATVNSTVTFNGEPTTQLVFKNISSGDINIDISGYEFNAGDVAVFYAKAGEELAANGLEYVDIRLNTGSAFAPINGNHLVVGKWTMCLIPAERLEEALTQLYFFGGKANGDTTEAWSIFGSIYLTKIKVYSADQIKDMTTFGTDGSVEYQIGQTTFVNSVENLTGTWNPNDVVFADDWDTNPYLIGDEVRVYVRPQQGVADKENALGFELKDAVDTHSGKNIYVVASGLTGTPYIQVFDIRGGTHYCTHNGTYVGEAEDGYVIYSFDIVDAWASVNPIYEADSMKYFRLWTGHQLTIPNYEAVMIRDIYIAE